MPYRSISVAFAPVMERDGGPDADRGYHCYRIKKRRAERGDNDHYSKLENPCSDCYSVSLDRYESLSMKKFLDAREAAHSLVLEPVSAPVRAMLWRRKRQACLPPTA